MPPPRAEGLAPDLQNPEINFRDPFEFPLSSPLSSRSSSPIPLPPSRRRLEKEPAAPQIPITTRSAGPSTSNSSGSWRENFQRVLETTKAQSSRATGPHSARQTQAPTCHIPPS
ncbi:hypothetical protein BOTBODRAFT_28352 [Botryobasidium botryosum FD-172 SS1]|uniref:Uncharacterized protein n=1 Tax=Botryobasidium botryosum (strain FD-172 SS1) TaxID=930990 RepID=A0A067MTF8_BOTB1|nr:hypothetical protein BOTBODRAFT_28352 [Botryobasidium botryosum FD-172 SS1]